MYEYCMAEGCTLVLVFCQLVFLGQYIDDLHSWCVCVCVCVCVGKWLTLGDRLDL